MKRSYGQTGGPPLPQGPGSMPPLPPGPPPPPPSTVPNPYAQPYAYSGYQATAPPPVAGAQQAAAHPQYPGYGYGGPVSNSVERLNNASSWICFFFNSFSMFF